LALAVEAGDQPLGLVGPRWWAVPPAGQVAAAAPGAVTAAPIIAATAVAATVAVAISASVVIFIVFPSPASLRPIQGSSRRFVGCWSREIVVMPVSFPPKMSGGGVP
jgi:hypothetical protein